MNKKEIDLMNKKEIIIIKRDGSKVPFDISKIKASIAFATEGIDVNPLQLEATLDQYIKNGMKTSDIQDNVIRAAVQLASPEQPLWLNVAGRALAMQMWANYKLRGKSFYEIVQYNIKKGEYTKDLLNFYTKEDIDTLGQYICHDRDLLHSHSSLITVSKKYLGKYELNQHMHMVSAMRFGQMESPENRLDFVIDLYDRLSFRKISLATPFMANLRKGGNTASCFILSVEDDLDSIFDNIKRIARISKNGGGLGIFLGYLRAKGSNIGNVSNASGSVTQWVKIINDTLVAVNQNGKRAGAGTVALPIWHNDILDFLDMQTEHGDSRLKSYDVFPQVTIPDIFMERDKENGKWVTFCPFEVKNKLNIDVRGLYGDKFTEAYLKIESAVHSGVLVVSRVHNARDITKTFMRTQFETGLPYISFTDTINAVNPNAGHKGSYGIVSSNLCLTGDTEIVVSESVNGDNVFTIRFDDFVEKYNLGFYTDVFVKTLDKTGKMIFSKISNAFLTKEVDEIIRIEYMGKTVECTPEHLIFTSNRGWVEAQNLDKTDTLMCSDGFSNSEQNFVSIEKIKREKTPVYDITVPETESFFANGVLVHNCTESFSNTMPDYLGHVCNLCSINLGNHDSMEDIGLSSRLSTRMLDYAIELTNNPDEITKRHNETFRTIGIGQMGLHDYLAKNWSSFSDLDTIEEISECIQYNAILESIDLASRFGSFGAFPESKWASGEMIELFSGHSNGKYDWSIIQNLIDTHGMRNSQLTSPAPTTSTSIYQDSSASILPVYSPFFSEDNKNGSLLVGSRYLGENPICYAKTFAKHSAKEIIDVVSVAQKFIDTGISMELIFDQNLPTFSAKDLYDAIHYAHSKKIKAIYYIRSIKKNATLETREDACVGCSG